MFALKMFYKPLIATVFHTHHFKMFLKCFLSNVLKKHSITKKKKLTHIFRMLIKCLPSNISKQQWQRAIIGDFRGLSKKLAHMQSLKVGIE